MDYSEQDEEARSQRRGGYPRFGSFVTIAVAILLLFGAASRMGKSSMDNIFSALDVSSKNRINQSRNEAIADTLIQIGPTAVSALAARPVPERTDNSNSVRPPSRGLVDPGYLDRQYSDDSDAAQDSDLQSTTRHELENDNNRANADFSFSQQSPQPAVRTNSYIVAEGDNWVKIAKRVLGDGKRWQELQNANPAARDGLKVGMKLTVPN